MRLVLALAATLAWVTPALAQDVFALIGAGVEHRADYTLIIDGARYDLRFHRGARALRADVTQRGSSVSFILELDTLALHQVAPRAREISSTDLGSMGLWPGLRDMYEGMERSSDGIEAVAGRQARRGTLVDRGRDEGTVVRLWSLEDGVVMRAVAVVLNRRERRALTVFVQARAIRVGRQDPALFAVPRNFRSVPPPPPLDDDDDEDVRDAAPAPPRGGAPGRPATPFGFEIRRLPAWMGEAPARGTTPPAAPPAPSGPQWPAPPAPKD